MSSPSGFVHQELFQGFWNCADDYRKKGGTYKECIQAARDNTPPSRTVNQMSDARILSLVCGENAAARRHLHEVALKTPICMVGIEGPSWEGFRFRFDLLASMEDEIRGSALKYVEIAPERLSHYRMLMESSDGMDGRIGLAIKLLYETDRILRAGSRVCGRIGKNGKACRQPLKSKPDEPGFFEGCALHLYGDELRDLNDQVERINQRQVWLRTGGVCRETHSLASISLELSEIHKLPFTTEVDPELERKAQIYDELKALGLLEQMGIKE